MKNLKLLREEAGRSQMRVALDLGMPQSTYQQYEAGIHEAGYDVLCQMADYFHVSVDFLLGHTEIRTPVEDADLKVALRIRQLGNPNLTEKALGLLEEIEGMIK